MNKRVEDPSREAMRLAPVERFERVERILETVDPTRPEVDAAWLAEAEARMAEYDRGGETFDADDIIEQLRTHSKNSR